MTQSHFPTLFSNKSDLLCPNLSYDQQRVILAHVGKKTLIMIFMRGSAAEQKDAMDSLTFTVSKTLTEMGGVAYKRDENEKERKARISALILNLTNALKIEIMNWFGKATADDVRTAFEFGVREYYGKNMGIQGGMTSMTFHRWMKGYFESELVREALEKQQAHINKMEAVRVIPDREKFFISASGCLQAFSEYKATGKISEVSHALFSFLQRESLIELSEENKDRLTRKAKEVLRQEAEDPESKMPALSMDEYKAQLFKDADGKVKLKRRELALQEQFDEWKISNYNLYAKLQEILDVRFPQGESK